MQDNQALMILSETNDLEDVKHLVEVEGMSSPKICNLLNLLVKNLDPEEHYLEIGTWKGLTLLSAAIGNQGKVCFACDKFRFWGRFTGWGYKAKRALYSNIEQYRDRCAEIRFFEMNSNTLFKRGLDRTSPIGIYFYDGDHSYQGTYKGIMSAVPLLNEKATLLVDDWKIQKIQKATYQAINDTGLKILWERSLMGSCTDDEATWWNGIGVFYLARKLSPR